MLSILTVIPISHVTMGESKQGKELHVLVGARVERFSPEEGTCTLGAGNGPAAKLGSSCTSKHSISRPGAQPASPTLRLAQNTVATWWLAGKEYGIRESSGRSAVGARSCDRESRRENRAPRSAGREAGAAASSPARPSARVLRSSQAAGPGQRARGSDNVRPDGSGLRCDPAAFCNTVGAEASAAPTPRPPGLNPVLKITAGNTSGALIRSPSALGHAPVLIQSMSPRGGGLTAADGAAEPRPCAKLHGPGHGLGHRVPPAQGAQSCPPVTAAIRRFGCSRSEGCTEGRAAAPSLRETIRKRRPSPSLGASEVTFATPQNAAALAKRAAGSASPPAAPASPPVGAQPGPRATATRPRASPPPPPHLLLRPGELLLDVAGDLAGRHPLAAQLGHLACSFNGRLRAPGRREGGENPAGDNGPGRRRPPHGAAF